MMTREEKLYSMTMKMLVAEAEKLGVKIDKKGSREKAVNKILAFEAEKAEAEKAKRIITEDTIKKELKERIEAVKEEKTVETKEEKKSGKKENYTDGNLFRLLDTLQLPEGVVVSKMRDGYTYKVGKKKFVECWNSRKNIRVCVNPEVVVFLDLVDNDYAKDRHDGWKNIYANENNLLDIMNQLLLNVA